MTGPHFSIFKQSVKNLMLQPLDGTPCWQEGPEVQLIIDTIGRQSCHHILIENSPSKKQFLRLLEAVAFELQTDKAPFSLKGASFYFFDIALINNETVAIEMEKAVAQLLEDASLNNRCLIFALNHLPKGLKGPLNLASAFLETLNGLLKDKRCRFIVFEQDKPSRSSDLKEIFHIVQWASPSAPFLLSLLKSYRTDLENFHQVMVPEEIFSFAMSMAEHYLSNADRFDKTYELLDSAAVRASKDHVPHHKPIVTIAHLMQVISSRTGVPLSHLQNNKFQATKFVESLQQTIFGQEAALHQIGSLLQNACIKLHKKPGPLCRLLLSGPPGTGKVKLAHAMADYLFNHQNALFRMQPLRNVVDLTDIMVTLQGPQGAFTLLDAIEKAPYAIILIEQLEQLPASAILILKDILLHGYVFDKQFKKYDFHNAIFVLTTTQGSERMADLSKTMQEKNRPVDLMQLVLNHDLQDFSHPTLQLTTQELRNELLISLKEHLPAELLEQLDIVPFLPLDYEAFEKIMSLALRDLAKRLDTQFKLELSYAPEIIKFLTQEAVLHHAAACSFDKLLQHHLSCVAHEVIAYHENNRTKAKRLLLKLNDHGTVLRCEMVNAESLVYQ